MKSLKQYLHDLERFGYTPKKLSSRFLDERKHLPRILSISIPKSGTNLIQRILTLHPQLYRRVIPTLGRRNKDTWQDWKQIFPKTKHGEIISSHFDYDPQLEHYLMNEAPHKLIFLARDPRDIVISDMYYDHPPFKAEFDSRIGSGEFTHLFSNSRYHFIRKN